MFCATRICFSMSWSAASSVLSDHLAGMALRLFPQVRQAHIHLRPAVQAQRRAPSRGRWDSRSSRSSAPSPRYSCPAAPAPPRSLPPPARDAAHGSAANAFANGADRRVTPKSLFAGIRIDRDGAADAVFIAIAANGRAVDAAALAGGHLQKHVAAHAALTHFVQRGEAVGHAVDGHAVPARHARPWT